MKSSRAIPPAILGTIASSAQAAVSAFTLVEIALSLAIIGLGLVAIIGVLPMGMNVQKENREETIINQDGTYWMDAIRSGARGLDDLTNYVEAITNVVTAYDANHLPLPNFPVIRGYGLNYPAGYELINGFRIIGLLSTPKYEPYPFSPAGPVAFVSNYVTARVRSMSGAAAEKPPQTNASIREFAFSYKLISEVVPYGAYDTNAANFSAGGLNPLERQQRTNYWRLTQNWQTNLHELRLTLRWPYRPDGTVGNGRQIFRTMVSGRMTNAPPNEPWYFVEPKSFLGVRLP